MTELSATPVVEIDSATRRLPRWALPAALLAFVVALYAASQVVGVLYALVKPPLPPQVEGATELAHSSEVYGADTWAYRAPLLAEDAAAYFAAQGGACSNAPFAPEQAALFADQFPDAGTHYAYCEGEQAFSRFVMRWRVLISTYDVAAADTRLDVVRQIDWFGSS
jgi:hypothetical protein